ncbi:hypothetical protein Taro_027239, partial [Colocasia esculenta]|nr:hypothetical protein [Colocasia esculenta]
MPSVIPLPLVVIGPSNSSFRISLVSEIKESICSHKPRSSPRCATILIERMVAEGSSVHWRLSEDPIWSIIKNDMREIRDMLVAVMQNTDCATNPILDVKCEEQEQVVIYEPDATLADKYEVEMQDLHNGQVTPHNMLSEASSVVSDSCVCTEYEINDTWYPELFSLSGLQSISYCVFAKDHPVGSPSTAVVDFEFTLEDFDVVWLDFCEAYSGRQLEICDIIICVACFTHVLMFILLLLRHFKIRSRIFLKWRRLTVTVTRDGRRTRLETSD